MNPTIRSKLVVTGIFVLIVFLAVGSSIAEPDFTTECGYCHSINPAYTMSSNSTGNASVGIPFTLRIVAQKPSMGGMGDRNFWLSVQYGWADNNNFAFTPISIKDNAAGDLTSSNFIITSDFTFTPLSSGNNTIRAWCATEGGSQFIDIPINVKTVAPTIDSPPDIQVDQGNMSASVTWNPTSPYPDRYEVYDNEGLSYSGAWDGSSITFGLGSLSVGSHNLTCIVYDVGFQTVADQVDVLIVDDVLPIINHLFNSTVSEELLESLTWTPSDLNPSSFEVYREGSLIDSGVWSGGNIIVSLAGVTIGEYNYTAVVSDTSGNTARDTTFVTIIDDTGPSIDHPIDIIYSLDTTGNTIEWNATDLHPDTFTVFREHIIIQSVSWSGTPIIVSIDGLGIGIYNFTILVNDTSGNWISDQVNVTVIVPPEPTIDHPSDQNIPEGSTSNTIEWIPDDVDPSRYEIFQDGDLVKSGLWNSSAETITISIDGLSAGVYDYEIIVYDDLNNTATDLVIVTVYDNTAPIIDTPSDIIINEGTIGQFISWSPSDLNPVSYEIFVDGVLMWSGFWNSSSEAINASCNSLAIGTHVFIIYVTDVGDITVSDEVVVSVLDGTSPIVNSPSDIVYVVSTTGHNITWISSDAHPSQFNVEINGVVVLSGGWDGNPIIMNVDWLNIGTYEYTLTVIDIGGNTQSDIVIVTVTSEVTSTTTETSTTTTTTDGVTTMDEELEESTRFSLVILATGIIAGILSLGLILDRWRKKS